jgi:hypothetical protein
VVTPLRAVLGAVEDGVTTRKAIVIRTGLDPDVVDAAVEHLVRLGRVSSPELRTGCPIGGCGGCGTGCSSDSLMQIGRRPAGLGMAVP